MAVTLLWTLKLHRTADGGDICRQMSLLEISWYKKRKHFCLGWTTATCSGEMQKEIFSLWGFIAGFGPFLLPLKEACGWKTQPRLSPFLKHTPWHSWTATCGANHIILPTPNHPCDVMNYHRSTLFFFFEGKREPSAVCKPQYHLPLPHKPQIKGLPFPNHREVPGAPRTRCLAVYLLLDTHMQDCAVPATCGKRENIPP